MEWTSLTYAYAKKKVKEGKLFLAAARDGQAYVGVVQSVTDRYIELTNGPHREILYYGQRAGMKFAIVDAPDGVTFGVADPSLPLSD